MEVLARLPRWERASRLASTRSRLGLLMARVGWRLGVGALSDQRDARGRGVGAGGAWGGATVAAGAGATSVREGRASAAVRTRMGAERKRPSAFLPPLVSALRRSRAASRLDVLAITTREKKYR